MWWVLIGPDGNAAMETKALPKGGPVSVWSKLKIDDGWEKKE